MPRQKPSSFEGAREGETKPTRGRPRVAGVLLLRLMAAGMVLVGIWGVLAYWIVPHEWAVREARHPALVGAERVTSTAAGIPGDPLNLFLIGSQNEVVAAMVAAGWHPADPITLETSLRIVESSVFHRAYGDAPVSNLFLFGRKEDLAFEKPVGSDPCQRHHVRLWKAAEKDAQGRPGWWASTTFDWSVGFSHTTGQITHHIAPQVDTERTGLMDDLQAVGRVQSQMLIPDFQQHEGRNGGGDPWTSDGRLGVLWLAQ